MPKNTVKYEPTDLFDTSIKGPVIEVVEEYDNVAGMLTVTVNGHSVMFDNKKQFAKVVDAVKFLGWY